MSGLMVVGDSSMVLPGVASLVQEYGVVFVVAVPVAVVAAMWRARRSSRSEGAAPATVAAAALMLTRIWIGLFLVMATFTLIGGEDRSLGDRLEFQEYGYTFPTGGGRIEEHDGPWLVLHHDAEIQICPKQSRPYPIDDPPVTADSSVCPAAATLRKTFGDVDIDRLELVRQVERPAANVEPRLNRLVFGGLPSCSLGRWRWSAS